MHKCGVTWILSSDIIYEETTFINLLYVIFTIVIASAVRLGISAL